MERKIGEIFEYNGEWYQCMKSNTCKDCAFYRSSCGSLNGKGSCSYNFRKDATNVIFKKLEKVGDPYLAHDHSRNKDVIVQDYKLYNQHACYNGHEEMLSFGFRGRNEIVTIKSKEPIKSLNCENSVEIQIEQNKEDMEEKKIKLSQDDIDWLKKQIRWTALPGYITHEEDYDRVTEEIMNLFIPSDTEHSSSEKIGKNLKPFDLDEAKAGKPVCTRDGRKARIICFDRIDARPILALVPSTDGKGEMVFDYFISGKRIANALESNLDLMMLSEKKGGWVNIVRGNDGKSYMGRGIFQSKEEAENTIKAFSDNLIDTVKINWEE